MKRRYILYQRGQTFYCEDTLNRKQMSLRTKDREVALRLLHSKNEAEQQPAINLQIARAYLVASDPQSPGPMPRNGLRQWKLKHYHAIKTGFPKQP